MTILATGVSIAAILAAILGAIIGSFIAVLTRRWPTGGSIVRPRSHCDTCHTPLTAIDLIPILSFILLRARCRHCGAAIAPRHLGIELAAAAIGALALALHPGLPGLFGAFFGWALLALAILDIEHFWLPDRLTLPLLAAGLLIGLAVAPPLPARLIGAVTGFLALAALAAGYKALTGRTGLGGGDPKLLAAIGAWLGWAALPLVLLLAASLGLGLVALDRLRGRPVTRQTRVPLGALMAAAAWPLWLTGLSAALAPAIPVP